MGTNIRSEPKYIAFLSQLLPGADLGFFVLQSKKNSDRAWSVQGVVDAEIGQIILMLIVHT